MASRIRPLVVLITLAAVFGAAWRLGLWLIVVTMAATAIALVVCEQLGERLLAHRAAALALYVPEGETEPSGLEQVLAADLAASAVSDTELLDHAVARAQRLIPDPWLLALATERLQMAKDLAESEDFPPPPRLLTGLARPAVRRATVAVSFGLAVAAAATRNHLMLVVLTAGVAAAAIGYGEARRRQELSLVLCGEAATAPASALVLVRELSVVVALSSLTSSRRRVLAKAISLVPAGPGTQRETALQRLAGAARRAPDRPRPTLTQDVCIWVVTAAATTAVLEVL